MKVLILGDGLLGSEIQKQTGWDYVSRKSNNLDINNLLDLPIGYDVIVNCIANTNTYSTDKKSHWDVNYKFVSKLIDYCNKSQIKVVHISTDYVYAGSVSNASEEDVPVHCNNWYGYTKLLGDGLVQLQSENYLLCRCTHKPNPFPYNEAWVDQIGNFDYVDKISSLIIELIKSKSFGLYNVGTETKTMYELASKTNNVSKTFTPEHVPKNQSMDISKLDKVIKPFFSIAIPTYGYNGKGAEFLEFSLDILTKQTFQDFEVIISDHSTDNTILDIFTKFKERFNCIKYFRNDVGRGIISPNINNAMIECSGKYIKVLFQDDFLYDKHSLQNQHNFIISIPNFKWLMTNFYHSNTGTDFYRPYNPVWNLKIWTGNNTMGCPSGMTLKNEDLLLFDEGLNWLMDVDYYQRMFIKYGEPSILGEMTSVNRTWGARLTDTISQDLKDKEFKMLSHKYA
jgi:dTDP-4-dehydrorhamnose reductase